MQDVWQHPWGKQPSMEDHWSRPLRGKREWGVPTSAIPHPAPVPSPDPVGEWMSYSTSVCLSLRRFWRGRALGLELEEGRALGRWTRPWSSWIVPAAPALGRHGRLGSLEVLTAQGLRCLDPASLRFSACGQTVSLQPALLASSATASTKHVLFLTLWTSPGRMLRTQADTGARGHPAPDSPALHYTSEAAGCWASYPGATRNTRGVR